MRFFSLYRYSYHKSPVDLRPAVIACKITLILSVLSTILFIFAALAYYNTTQYSSSSSTITEEFELPIGKSNSSSSFSNGDTDTSEKLIKPSSTTTTEQQSNERNEAKEYFKQYSILICLITGISLLLLSLIALIYSYQTYKHYLTTRLLSYQLVNRSFDQLQLKYLAKNHVREPIVSHKKGGATILVPKTSLKQQQQQLPSQGSQNSVIDSSSRYAVINHHHHNNNNNNNNNNNGIHQIDEDIIAGASGPHTSGAGGSKFAAWARSKWFRRVGRAPRRPIAKEMTI